MTGIGAPSSEERHASLSPPPGIVALRLPLFDSPARELMEAVHPPWPRWMKRMYKLEEATDPGIDVSEGETTIAAALSVLASELKHRLDILAFVTGELEAMHWNVEMQDGALVASARMRPYDARHALEAAGIAGPLCAVTEIDDAGWPRMWYGGDA